MKKVISTFFAVLFVIIVVVCLFVATYIFNKPTHEKQTESRSLILGYWSNEEEDVRFYFNQEGEFKITKESDPEHVYAKGYFKVSEDTDKIKMLVLPKNRDKDFDMGEQLYFFSTITYKNLVDEEPDFKVSYMFLNSTQQKELMESPASVQFIFTTVDDKVIKCDRTRTVQEFYDGKDHDIDKQ